MCSTRPPWDRYGAARRGGETPRNGSAKSRDDLRRLHRPRPRDGGTAPTRRRSGRRRLPLRRAPARRASVPRRRPVWRPRPRRRAAPCWQGDADADRRDPVRRRKRPLGPRRAPTRARADRSRPTPAADRLRVMSSGCLPHQQITFPAKDARRQDRQGLSWRLRRVWRFSSCSSAGIKLRRHLARLVLPRIGPGECRREAERGRAGDYWKKRLASPAFRRNAVGGHRRGASRGRAAARRADARFADRPRRHPALGRPRRRSGGARGGRDRRQSPGRAAPRGAPRIAGRSPRPHLRGRARARDRHGPRAHGPRPRLPHRPDRRASSSAGCSPT